MVVVHVLVGVAERRMYVLVRMLDRGIDRGIVRVLVMPIVVSMPVRVSQRAVEMIMAMPVDGERDGPRDTRCEREPAPGAAPLAEERDAPQKCERGTGGE